MSDSIEQQFAKIKELYEAELAAQTVVTTLDQIPFSYELISDEWLSKAICRDAPGVKVVSHTLDEPDEGTSNRRKIFLEYNDAGRNANLPSSVFCKASQSLSSRYQLGLNRAAEAEVNFYNNIRPALDIEAPKAIFAGVDTQSFNSIIMLENLSSSVRFGDYDTQITRSLAESQMQMIAQLNGTYYESAELDSTFSSLNNMADFWTLCDKTTDWLNGCIRGFEMAEQVIPPQLFARAEEVSALTPESYFIHRELPRTVLHGDTHPKNWYITADGRMGLADWQMLLIGHWSRDLAYTLSSSLTIENRRAWEVDLIRLYLEKLEEAGGVSVSFDEAMLMYRQQLISALSMWTGTIGAGAESPDMQPQETSLEFISRITHAIDDHNALDSFG